LGSTISRNQHSGPPWRQPYVRGELISYFKLFHDFLTESTHRTFRIEQLLTPPFLDIATIQGISVASYNVGCFVGAVITIFIGDLLGRRKMIFLGSCIMIIGAILQCTAFSLAHLIVGRIITGFGNGTHRFELFLPSGHLGESFSLYSP
jgi:MFS family permease